jgi:hypothetical protein
MIAQFYCCANGTCSLNGHRILIENIQAYQWLQFFFQQLCNNLEQYNSYTTDYNGSLPGSSNLIAFYFMKL